MSLKRDASVCSVSNRSFKFHVSRESYIDGQSVLNVSNRYKTKCTHSQAVRHKEERHG